MAIRKYRHKYLRDELFLLRQFSKLFGQITCRFDSDVSILSETSHLQSRFQRPVDYLIALNLSNTGKPLISDYHATNHQGDKNTDTLALRDKQIFFLHLFVLWLLKTIDDWIYHVFLLPFELLKLGGFILFRKIFSCKV